MTQPAEQSPATIAVAVIVAGGRALMVRRRAADGELTWQFPTGEVEPAESAEDAAVRAARVLTGLSVVASRRLGERVHPTTGRALVYLACDVADGFGFADDGEDPEDLAEVAEVAWCDRATLNEYVPGPLFEPVQEYLNGRLTY